MEPEAMYWPVGSNRAAKTSPECPVNSMTGDCSAPPRCPYSSSQPTPTCSWCAISQRPQREHTACMSAPFCPVPLDIATAVLSRFASDFARLTSWLEPNASFAGRFDWDMFDVVRSLAARSGVRGVAATRLWRSMGSSCKLS